MNTTKPVTLLPFLSFCKNIPTHTQTLRVNTTPTYTWVINLISLPSSAPRLSFCSAPLCVDLKYLLVSVFVYLYLVFFVIFISFWGSLSASDGFPSNRGVCISLLFSLLRFSVIQEKEQNEAMTKSFSFNIKTWHLFL